MNKRQIALMERRYQNEGIVDKFISNKSSKNKLF